MGLFERIFTDNRRERCAVLFDQRAITYAELRDETLRAGEILRALDIEPGDRVALMLADSPEFIASFVAIISLGAIAVPINLALRPEHQQFILNDCGACAAILEASSKSEWFANSTVPSNLRNVILVRDNEAIPDMAGVRLQHFESAERAPTNSPFPDGRAAEKDDAFILYTSGSTGEPKGAVHTQADIFYTNETFCREVLKLRAGDRLFSSSRLPFAYGLGNGFTFPLLNGATTILCRPKPSPDAIAKLFKEQRPTMFFGEPVIYNLLFERHRNG